MNWYVVWKGPGESKCRWVRGEDGGWIRALAENARRGARSESFGPHSYKRSSRSRSQGKPQDNEGAE
jgi:hypothetical protein